MNSHQYALAVDVGTSRTAAATARAGTAGEPVISTVPLGRRGDNVATVAFVTDDGDLLFADAGERRGFSQPERLIREFKRGVGDDVPISVAGRSLRPEDLFARSFAAVVQTVTEREGTPPAAIALTHPTAWGPHRLSLIEQSLARVGVHDVGLIAEPEAAARHYGATHPFAPGQAVAVYDLGGGTFDAVVIQHDGGSTFTVRGDVTGMDDLGGADFDDAMLRHVLAATGISAASLRADDLDARLALHQLRRDCIEAKEALSFDSDAVIPVFVGGARSSVRVTRTEFEAMIEPALQRTVDALDRTIDSADLAPEQLAALVLIGGSSRIPLVAERLSERFDRPVAIDADPKASISLGAARTAFARLEERALAVVPVAAAAAVSFDDIMAPHPVDLLPPRAARATKRGEHAPRRGFALLITAASVTVAGGLVVAGAMAASSLTSTEEPSDGSRDVAALYEPLPVAAGADFAQPVTAPAQKTAPLRKTAPMTKALRPHEAPPTKAVREAEADSESSAPAHRPTKAPTPSAPSGSDSTPTTPSGTAGPTPTSTPKPTPTSTPTPTPTPTNPPADPTPTDPPADPTPTNPPADPTPTNPPADPTPTDPPADPSPSDPPADPPPSEPDPTPVPTELPTP